MVSPIDFSPTDVVVKGHSPTHQMRRTHTLLHRRRTKEVLEAATQPDPQAPPANPVDTAHGQSCVYRPTSTAPRWC